MLCPNCGADNPDRARFCSSCRTALQPGVIPVGAPEYQPVRRSPVPMWAACLLVSLAVGLGGAALLGFALWGRLHSGSLAQRGGVRMVLLCQTDALKIKPWDRHWLQLTEAIVRRRVDSLGVAEPVVYSKGSDRIVVELPGFTDQDRARDVIATTANLEFRYVPELDPGGEWHTQTETVAGPKGETTTGFAAIMDRDGKPVPEDALRVRVFEKEPVLTGAQLKPNAMPDVQQGQAIIHFEFQDKDKGTFEDFTRAHVGKSLAIFFDRKLIAAPVIQNMIPGEGIVEGNFTPEQVSAIASQLNAGALPVPVTVETLTVVKPR